METWRAVPRSRWSTDGNTVSRLRRSVVQEIGWQWQPAVATMIDGDLEVCGPSQPLVDRCQYRFTATTERSPPGNQLAMAAGRGNADRSCLGSSLPGRSRGRGIGTPCAFLTGREKCGLVVR